MEESKRDVSLEELLNDNSQNRQKRINKDKKSIEIESRINSSVRTHKKSLHSTPSSSLSEYIVLITTVKPASCLRKILTKGVCLCCLECNGDSVFIVCPLSVIVQYSVAYLMCFVS